MSKERPTTLAERLDACGCTMSAADFRDTLAEVFHALFPSWTDEELLVHPSEAIRYCAIIRRRADCDLPSELILRALTNIRKNQAAA